MLSSLVVDKTRIVNLAAEVIGSKAWRLQRVLEAGFSVPEFYVVSADALRHYITLPEFDGGEQRISAAAAEMRQNIETATMTPEFVNAIRDAHQSCFPEDCAVAVRSSAVAEDGTSHSFAGMYESVLGVRSLGGLDVGDQASVDLCRQSASDCLPTASWVAAARFADGRDRSADGGR